MLTSEIKQKIDSARNILVGKIPTPTGQVEQITLALVYKFMNDIDEQNKELGGELKFFTGDYQKYAWKNLLDKSLSAYEWVTAYGEGLEKMHLNPNLPQFFRNVFRGAFLPFRDPEVLTIFLKQIDEFRYGVNGDLGDAFEYLLQVMGTQGDAGQFLTPRHHINFIVSVVDPQKTDKTLDPAEGTAGFLISSYLHILRQNTKPGSDLLGSALTYDERKKLSENFVGYDISHDMVRLSLVNLYLHGFADPRIYEYDTLGNVDRWDDDFDCILTNPPFMTPRGGVKPHRRFSIQAKRSEVLFVDYIMEHLNPNGKAGIIVPEGIIFQSATAYKALRKMMIDQNFLYAVVSLPAGIFQPYSGVKTSILFMDRVLAKKTNDILFVKIENDGFDLGAQRRPIDKNDLPKAAEIIKRYKLSLQTGKPFVLSDEDKQMASLVPIEKIGKSGDYNLSGDRYKEIAVSVNQKWPLVDIGSVIETITPPQKIQKSDFNIKGKYPIIDQSQEEISGWSDNDDAIIPVEKPLVIFGDHTCAVKYVDKPFIQGADGIKILFTKETLFPKYLFYSLKYKPIESDGYKRHFSKLRETKIPLPPFEVQQEIVSQLDSYQKIIDGAKQIVDNYKPEIKIDPDWELKKLGDICELISGQHIMSEDYNENGEGTPYLTGPFDFGTINPVISKWTTKPKVIAKQNDILITVKGSGIGKLNILNIPEVSISRQLMAIRSTVLDSSFLYTILFDLYDHFQKEGVGAAIPGLDRNDILSLKIPLPPLNIQRQIVSRIEEEQ